MTHFLFSQVADFDWPHKHVPDLEKLVDLCRNLDSWLRADPQNIIVVHCHVRGEGGREGGREKGREGGKEGGRKGGREGGKEGGRKGEREGGRKGGRKGGREGGREKGREGGNKKRM